MKREYISIKKKIKKKIEKRHDGYLFIQKRRENSNVKQPVKPIQISSLSGSDKTALRAGVYSPPIPFKQTEIGINEEIDKYFSIVIPTMWKSNKIFGMLPVYEKSKYVKEIIIIDNNPKKKIDLSEYKKIRYYTKGKNIYVNPSWNWGYALSNYNLILANDDIIINDSLMIKFKPNL